MIYDVMNYGAVADGKKDTTEAIQAAINACTITGGCVHVPSGVYLCGLIELKSNIEFHLEQGAVIRSNLDRVDMKYLLYAKHEKNIVISGTGCIDGQGTQRFVKDDEDGEIYECPLDVSGARPRTTYFEDITNLTVKDITFEDAAFWTLHMAGCKNVIVDGIKIINNDRGPNNDGIDPDCCKNVVIKNCIISTGDDAIVVKATEEMAKKYGSCEDIVIQGCILHSRDAALKIGSETFANIRNIMFSDCIVQDCSRGLGIYSRDGGVISDIFVHHIMGTTRQYADCPERDYAPRWWGKGEPLFISATPREHGSRVPGMVKNIFIDHIRFTSESAIFIAGEEESLIESVRITDADITWKKQGSQTPGVFDEQPSKYNVYKHDIPCVYGRSARNVVVSGRFIIDENMKDYIHERQLLSACTNFRVIQNEY